MPEWEDRDTVIELTMPLVKFEYTAKSEQRRRASGIQYMLLKMIGYSEQVSSRLKIKDVMSIFSISVDLTPFILSELALLAKTDMVTLVGTTVDKLSANTPMANIRISDRSRTLYETGFVRSKIEDLRDDLMYVPMRFELFRRTSDIESADLTRTKIEVDTDELRSYLCRMHPDSEITDVRITRERKDRDGNIISQGPKIRGYPQKVYLYFNISEGCFEVDADRSGIILERVRERYKGDALLKKLDDSLFILGDEDGFEVNYWAMEPPEGVAKRMLPKDFRVMKGLFFYGSRIKNNNPPDARFQRIGDDIGCDAILITDSEHLCKYWFAKGDISVKGFEGVRKNQNLVYFQPVTSADTVGKYIQRTVSNLKLPGDLDVLNRISSAAHDPSVFADAVCERIENGSRAVFADTLLRINRLPQKIWKPLLEDRLEEILCRKMLSGETLKDVTEFCTVCAKNGYALNGGKLVGTMKAKYPITDVADWAIVNDIGKKAVLNDADLPREVMSLIMEEGTGTYESELLKNASSAGKAFSQLKKITGIEVPDGYCLDISTIDRENSEIPALVAKLYAALDMVSEELPSVAKDRRFDTLSGLRPVYTALSGYLRSRKTKWSRSDIRNEENPLLFCSVLERKMSQALSRMDMADIGALEKSGIVDAEASSILKEFVEESRKICTASFDRHMDPSERTAWIDAVLELEEQS